jgi:hypothetical protein
MFAFGATVEHSQARQSGSNATDLNARNYLSFKRRCQFYNDNEQLQLSVHDIINETCNTRHVASATMKECVQGISSPVVCSWWKQATPLYQYANETACVLRIIVNMPGIISKRTGSYFLSGKSSNSYNRPPTTSGGPIIRDNRPATISGSTDA